MSLEWNLPDGQTDGVAEKLLKLRVLHDKAHWHRFIASSPRNDEFFGGPFAATWERLHDITFDPVPAELLQHELLTFYSLAAEDVRRQSPAPRVILARYLAGVHGGLADSIRGNEWWRNMWDRQTLIEQLAAAEANLMLTSKGAKSLDHDDIIGARKYILPNHVVQQRIIDPRFYLGRVIAFEYALGRRAPIPTEIPPVPRHLVESLQISLPADP
jgi:hypothetical protein